MDVKAIEEQAREELEFEQYRRDVDEAKIKLRNRKGSLAAIFPYKLILVRR